MMKPNWSTAPSWANYLVQDKAGEWWWYQFMPRVEWCDSWVVKDGRVDTAGHSTWRDSLEERPVEAEGK